MRMVATTVVAALGAIIALVPESASAWGQQGHRTVCEIAYRNLTSNSRSALADIMQSYNGGRKLPAKRGQGGSTKARTYTAFTYGCLEQDTRPREHPKDHFINVYRDTDHIQNDCPPKSPGSSQRSDCIISAIDRSFAILSDATKSKNDRADALMAIGHWVGDIHQPLHVSFGDDAGGNGIAVSVTGSCKGTKPDKFHSLWDGCLVTAGIFAKAKASLIAKRQSTAATSLPFEAASLLYYDFPLDQEIQLVSTKPWQWAEESYQITIAPETLYCSMAAGRCVGGQVQPVKIDQSYINLYATVAEQRIQWAGFRLGHLINEALDPNYTRPFLNKHDAS